MGNIVTKGLKGNWKTILKGFFGFPAAVGVLVKFCELSDTANVNQLLSDESSVGLIPETESFITQKLSTESGL